MQIRSPSRLSVLLLLGAMAASFTAQSSVAAMLDAPADGAGWRAAPASGAVALWLMIVGLLLVAVGLVLALELAPSMGRQRRHLATSPE